MLNVEIVIHNELARFIALKREPSAPSEKLLRFVERSAEASVEKLQLVALDGDAVEKQHHTVCRVFRRPVVRGILVCGRVAVELPYLPEKLLGVGENEVFVCSTGVIGQKLPVEKVLDGVRQIIPAKLDKDNGSDAAYAIMTTDTVRKESAYELELSSGTIRIGAMAKGSGMIHPNMATTLAYVTTDAKCDSADLQKMLHNAIDKSFNMCTVDGDTSTNDTMILLANGASGVEVKTEEDKAALVGLIEHICIDMARRIASDGEGATHLIVVESYGLPTEHDARLVAKAIAGSTLFKAAVFGRDANWGRIMAAAGYSGADVDPTKADCIIKSSAGEVQVMKDGFGTDFSEELAKAVLTEHDITVIVDFHSGDGKAVAYGCDLTYEYVKINGDYRT